MKILFCQFSSDYINKHSKKDISDFYYDKLWENKEKDGYCKSRHFWELPLWVAEGSYILKKHKQKLHIITNLNESIKRIKNSEADFILFSVLDVNKNDIKIIIEACPDKKFIIGGYVDFSEFKHDNVTIMSTMQELSKFFKLDYSYGLNYQLFKNYKTIPRLTLSTGCKNLCKFCTVEKIINKKSIHDINQQIKSFKNLKFKLVYLNDKTFGQSENYTYLKACYDKIKAYNPNFKGFIVQTTCAQLLNNNFVNNLNHLHVFAVELGIESYNDKVLHELKKPQNLKTIRQAIAILKKSKIKIIGNFVIGFLQENKKTYDHTLHFINKNLNQFYFLNIYNLAVYDNTELSKEVKTNNKDDKNENTLNKSFYKKNQLKNNEYFYNSIFKLGIKILNRG